MDGETKGIFKDGEFKGMSLIKSDTKLAKENVKAVLRMRILKWEWEL